jgi:hypothetical protein
MSASSNVVFNRRAGVALLAIAVVLAAGAAGGRTGAAQQPACGPADRGEIAYGASAAGRLDSCVTEERWTFEGERGQVVIITMERPQPPTLRSYALDPVVRLFAATEGGFTRLVGENDDGGIGLDSRLETRLAASGRYQIVTRGLDESMGDYRLTLKLLGVGAPERGEIRPDETVTGRIDEWNPEDIWWFEGRRGQRVLISMQRTRPLTIESLLLDPLLYLIQPEEAGMMIVEARNDDDINDLDALIVGTLERDGRYRILATRLGDRFGTYRLTLRLEDATRDEPSPPAGR